MATARCYTCHTLRPLSDFPYRRKDTGISATSRFKRYIGVVLQKPGASNSDKLRRGGVILRYRCVDPQKGLCPAMTQRPWQSPGQSRGDQVLIEVEVEVDEQEGNPLPLDRRRHSEDLHNEIEVQIEVAEPYEAGKVMIVGKEETREAAVRQDMEAETIEI